jgi:16S rRNA (guanine527-N7)-methyltransferase
VAVLLAGDNVSRIEVQMKDRELENKIIDDSAEVGISVSEVQASLLLKHLKLVVAENEKTNLTRITNLEDAVDLHVVDSLLFGSYIPGQDQRIVDIGTGAGFPSIPLAVTSNNMLIPIDSAGKKILAVKRIVERLGLADRVSPLHVRAEELAVDCRGFDYVVVRAVAPFDVLLEYASPLLKEHGRLIVSKGPSNELPDNIIESVGELVGMSMVSRETFRIPHGKGTRTLSVFVKRRKPQLKLPRRVGMASKHPLREKF